MRKLPRERVPDSTIPFLRDPYRFISRRAQAHGEDVFEARILMQRTICMTGPDAVALFYDADRFERRGASPEPVRKTLFGEAGVQTLDGERHRRRKEMLLSILGPARIQGLVDTVVGRLRERARSWALQGQVVVYDELQDVLTEAVCAWAAMPLPPLDREGRRSQLAALFDRAGAIGRGHLVARKARRSARAWCSTIVRSIRRGSYTPPPDTVAAVIARYEEPEGRLLPVSTAAVELLNVLRPTVAVSLWGVFIVHALHGHPAYRERLRSGAEAELPEWFAHEVRRTYPFFPAVAARIRESFAWRGYRFPKGRRVLLDLYGTNHDARTWASPHLFRPERFAHWSRSPYDFVPQGGGSFEEGHRCAGEWLTVALMRAMTRFFASEIDWKVPEQNLDPDFSRLPAAPPSRMILQDVRPLGQVQAPTFVPATQGRRETRVRPAVH